MFFEDLLKTDNFTLAVSNLAGEFRDRYELPGLHQLGLVVPDVEAAAVALEAQGMGPFFIASGKPVSWVERGVENSFEGKMGIAYHKGVEVELLEPGTGSDFYAQRLDPESRMVIQHLGFIVGDVDGYASRLAKDGYPVWVRGKLRAGPATTDFAYMDTVKETGLVIEFICWKFLGVPMKVPPAIFRTVGIVEKAIGIRCLSV
jgi:hypothetical protein